MTKHDLAQKLNLSVRQIERLLKDGKIKSNPDGGIIVDSIIDFLVLNRDKAVSKKTADDNLKKVRTELLGLKLDIEKGTLLKRSDIENMTLRAGTLLRDLILDSVNSLPDKLTGKETKEIQNILSVHLHKILTDFSSELKNEPDKKSTS